MTTRQGVQGHDCAPVRAVGHPSPGQGQQVMAVAPLAPPVRARLAHDRAPEQGRLAALGVGGVAVDGGHHPLPLEAAGGDVDSALVDQGGAGLIEYALILSIVSVTAILAMIFLRTNLMGLFSNIGNTVGQYPN